MSDLLVDIATLPEDVREKLAELDLELSEGDITQKGYEKKRTRLLQPYIAKNAQQGNVVGSGNGGVSNLPPYYNLQQKPDQQQTTTAGTAVGGSGGGGGTPQLSSEGYSYVTEVPSLQSSHHRHSSSHHKTSSSSSHHHPGGGGGGGSGGGLQNRARRTQRRVTHNEKRYHSDKKKNEMQLTPRIQFERCKLLSLPYFTMLGIEEELILLLEESGEVISQYNGKRIGEVPSEVYELLPYEQRIPYDSASSG